MPFCWQGSQNRRAYEPLCARGPPSLTGWLPLHPGRCHSRPAVCFMAFYYMYVPRRAGWLIIQNQLWRAPAKRSLHLSVWRFPLFPFCISSSGVSIPVFSPLPSSRPFCATCVRISAANVQHPAFHYWRSDLFRIRYSRVDVMTTRTVAQIIHKDLPNNLP